MRYVIFSGGDFTPSQLADNAIRHADKIIAADSGADTALKLGIYPAVVLGDMDSISAKTKKILEKKKTTFIRVPEEKDETDTQLAIDYAHKHNATEVTILGAVAGDRFDHIIANLFLAATAHIPIRFIQKNQCIWVAKGPNTLCILGKKNDLLSLMPLVSDVHGITTKNLFYPLRRESLFFGLPRGVSNVFTKESAEISFTEGTLLFIHTIV